MKSHEPTYLSFRRYKLLLALTVVVLVNSAALLVAQCGDDADYPEATINIDAHYGCSGVYNAITQQLDCRKNFVNGCGGNFMMGPGNCVCTGTGTICDKGFVGPPNPVEKEYQIYHNKGCYSNEDGTFCLCVNEMLGMSAQSVSSCMACPSGG
jgi:hypothetical protein